MGGQRRNQGSRHVSAWVRGCCGAGAALVAPSGGWRSALGGAGRLLRQCLEHEVGGVSPGARGAKPSVQRTFLSLRERRSILWRRPRQLGPPHYATHVAVQSKQAQAEAPAAKGAPSSSDGQKDADVAGQALAGSSIGGMSQAAKDRQDNYNILALGVVSALLCCFYVYATQGVLAAAQWFSCYVIEYSLSVDNLFVFIVIFDFFKLPSELQSRCLNAGIIGAIVFRFIFVYLGAELLQSADFLILIFAAILIYASYAGFTKGDNNDDQDLENSFVIRTLKNFVEISPSLDGDKFFTEVAGRTVATPLFLCLLVIEFSDIIFATDSVPAVLATTKEPFIAYSSNVFAIFGLRSLFFVLRDAMTEFVYLEPAVNTVLGFIGVKIITDYFDIVEIPVLVSLGIVVCILSTGLLLSIREMSATRDDKRDDTPLKS